MTLIKDTNRRRLWRQPCHAARVDADRGRADPRRRRTHLGCGRARPAEAALRERGHRLRLALEASGGGSWTWDPRTNVAHWDDGFRTQSVRCGRTAALRQLVRARA